MWSFEKNLPFKSHVVGKPICKCFRAHRQPLSRSFGTNETQQLREGQLVGRIMLQRLATGATGVKQARYRRSIDKYKWAKAYTGQRGTRTRMRSYIDCI